MNIALTGSSGLIGSKLLLDLKNMGHDVLCISSSHSSPKDNIFLYEELKTIKVNFKVEKDAVDTLKIVLLCIVFFVWIYFLERTGFILTSLIAFNLLILINTGLSISVKKIIIYMITGSIFILVLYLGFKTLLLVPLPEGLWFRDI